jgi:ABC-2 type transport system ATP-binding protein
VIDVTIFGDRLHLLLHSTDAAAGLPPFLARHGIACGPPRAITPSLEDVFVQLVTRPPA